MVKLNIKNGSRLKLKMNYWIGFLSVLIVLLLSIVIFYRGTILADVSIEILGASVFVLLISIVFRKIMV